MHSVPRYTGHGGPSAPKRRPARLFNYGRRWMKLRRLVLQEHDGRCHRCGRGAQEVHHIRPVSDAPELAYDPTNLMPLCRPCHDAEHGDGRRRA